MSLVLIGVRNSVTFSLFNVTSDAISGTGDVLPPALQFGQNNTQTGGGVSYSHQLSGLDQSWRERHAIRRTTINNTTGPLTDARSNNGNAALNLSTQFGPKTTGSAGVSYSRFDSPGRRQSAGNISSVNVFASVSHTF